ncbi:HPF/RaiA family ribosome-associated protein [Leptolyngbya sp. BC1307]|uniref:HPF/RaiA family ribosome-associated protein n=1 Tax=Leptolyngbya sp. BC1307 TaxID=2029589 RepID=UPI000EFD92CC|nr:HPF/RaiA family ribosome-associated protein [Leptolyngbya sp. BC1307]
MRISPIVTYRGVNKTDALESLIAEKIEKLELAYDQISSCRIAIEKVNARPGSGSFYRVRIDITVPENREVVVDKHPEQGKQYPPLEAVIRDVFDLAFRQLRELSDQQHNHMTTHIPGNREIVLDDLPAGEVPAPPADTTAG